MFRSDHTVTIQKLEDQSGKLPSGKDTQNGLFTHAVDKYKNEGSSPELIKVYEKILFAFCSAKWWSPRYGSLGTTIRISIFYGAKLLRDVAILSVKILCGFLDDRERLAYGGRHPLLQRLLKTPPQSQSSANGSAFAVGSSLARGRDYIGGGR